MSKTAAWASFETLKVEAVRLREENEQLERQVMQLEKEIRQLKAQGTQAQARDLSDRLLSEKSAEIGLVNIISSVPGLEGHESLRMLADSLRQKEKLAVIFLSDPQGNCVVSCDETAQKSGVRADALLKLAAEVAGGSGGGRANMAQGRLKDSGRFREVRDRLRLYLQDQGKG